MFTINTPSLRDPAYRQALRTDANRTLDVLNAHADGVDDATQSMPYMSRLLADKRKDSELLAAYNCGWDSVRSARHDR